MRPFLAKIYIVSALVCLSLIPVKVLGQTYRFRHYTSAENLPSEVIYTIEQDNSGFLWVGTTEGISRFDGIEFYRVEFPDSSSGRYPSSTLKDRSGTLWFGCNDGTLFHTSGAILEKVILPDASGTAVSSIIEGPGGTIYVITQRQPVFKIDPARPDKAVPLFLAADQNFFCAAFSASGELLLGTQENLLILSEKGDSLSVTASVDGFDYARLMSIYSLDNGSRFLIGTDGNGLFLLDTQEGSNALSGFNDYDGLENLEVNSLMSDSQGYIWVATRQSGAVRIRFTSEFDSIASVKYLDRFSGLPGDNVLSLHQDAEDNIWIGFNGNGLSMLGNDAFEFHMPGGGDKPDNIIFPGMLGSNYVLGTPEGFYIYDPEAARTVSFTNLTSHTGRKDISSYFVDDSGNIWFGTKGAGLFICQESGKVKRFFSTGDSGADYINDIEISGDNIWLATLNGVLLLSVRTGALKVQYNRNNGLAHNSINQILSDDEGNAYVATESERLFIIDPASGISDYGVSMYGLMLNKVVGLTRDSRGVIWAATHGNGVYECYPDSVNPLNTADGLLSNYTYSIFADGGDNIWIGHERGISFYNREKGIIRVYSTDFARGGSCNANGMYEARGGKILIGTTEGLIVYDRSKDRENNSAPANNIVSVIINDVIYPYQSSYSLPYRKRYNIRVNYTGINFSNPEKVFYSTFLENYDDRWSEATTSREVSYNLRDGRYRFNLISVNEDGLTQDNPLTFVINIRQPVWRTWWFLLLMMGLAAGIVVLIVREREKAQKKIQAYLESELEARTRVVMHQKAELEKQNVEITDSINYARRIQSSILPDIKKLREQFNDAFIMLYPRDIVSGDFYWFDRLDNDKFILVCADSTGHGVPGAFMSMIGSTLLQDIVSRQKITRPSEILSILDKQIFSTLNQNLELGVSNDGMDIVVCEFTRGNRHLRFASAMRPVVIITGGETLYIKGNRSSVGGQSAMEKYFDDQEYFLNEGDLIYLFSDGLPDQFGGPEGKKMKVARLKTFIEETANLQVGEQEKALIKFYEDWKKGFDQVDDILFMGVRI
ncbi:MAG: two-component regulator propeller domain-containing protein [Bacteroidales bacterium]|jgi:ligand-binding sensor domain-containing protein/serine phosphatase RsbU (regulator of sigma subunit)|nr:two-component regulator propeller domain-containing protein [Bacteroidales bacterium]